MTYIKLEIYVVSMHDISHICKSFKQSSTIYNPRVLSHFRGGGWGFRTSMTRIAMLTGVFISQGLPSQRGWKVEVR